MDLWVYLLGVYLFGWGIFPLLLGFFFPNENWDHGFFFLLAIWPVLLPIVILVGIFGTIIQIMAKWGNPYKLGKKIAVWNERRKYEKLQALRQAQDRMKNGYETVG